jgi:hypothetical protein
MAQIIRCGNCGREIGEKKKCQYCGLEASGPTPDDLFDAAAEMRVHKVEAQGRGARAIMILAAVTVVLMAAGIAFYFLAAQMPPPSPDPTPAVADANTTAPAGATDATTGSTAVAPDAVNSDNLNRPLTAGGATAAGNSAPPEPVAEGELTEKQAVERVMALPEVKKWMALVEKNAPKNRTVFKSEGLQMGRYLIHAYEDVNDGNGQSHNATFGWYEVDKKTGEAVKSEE